MIQISGVRFLDMDVSYISNDNGDYWEEGIVLIHGDAYSRSLRKALEEINAWLSCSKKLSQNLYD